MKFWIDKKILVTGGYGFLGNHVVAALKGRGVPEKNIFIPISKECDLRIKKSCEKAVFDKDIVIHLAAHNRGVIRLAKQAEIFYDNAAMALHLIDASYRAGVRKFVGIGSACEYPDIARVPFSEENIWNGYPEKSYSAYGLSKRMMLAQSQAYHQQHGFNALHLLLTNMYGPGDDFGPKSSYVIPTLIRRIGNAQNRNESFIEAWSSEGASREFLYVEDAAEAIVLATERYNKPEPVNIGSGSEITISDLVALICRLMDFRGEIRWDRSKPDGQPRRCLDVSRAWREFGFRAKTGLEEGVKRTIDWYLKEK